MFGDKLSIKAVLLSFVAYVVLAVAAFVILFQIWLPSGLLPQDAALQAESAPMLVVGQLIIGFAFGVAAGALACHLSGAVGLRNSVALGLVFVVYGVFSVILHPASPAWLHAIHLLAPLPTAVLGGYLRLRASASSAVRAASTP
jgi:hypothetical protein